MEHVPASGSAEAPVINAFERAQNTRLGAHQTALLVELAGGDFPDAARESGLQWSNQTQENAWRQIGAARQAQQLLLEQKPQEAVAQARKRAKEQGRITLDDIPNPNEHNYNAVKEIATLSVYLDARDALQTAKEPAPERDMADDQGWRAKMNEWNTTYRTVEPVITAILKDMREDLLNKATTPEEQAVAAKHASELTLNDINDTNIREYANKVIGQRISQGGIPQHVVTAELAKMVKKRLYTYDDLLGPTPEDRLAAEQPHETPDGAVEEMLAEDQRILNRTHPDYNTAHRHLLKMVARARHSAPGRRFGSTPRKQVANKLQTYLDKLHVTPEEAAELIGIEYPASAQNGPLTVDDLLSALERTNPTRTYAKQSRLKWKGNETQSAAKRTEEIKNATTTRLLAERLRAAKALRQHQQRTPSPQQQAELKILELVLRRLGVWSDESSQAEADPEQEDATDHSMTAHQLGRLAALYETSQKISSAVLRHLGRIATLPGKAFLNSRMWDEHQQQTEANKTTLPGYYTQHAPPGLLAGQASNKDIAKYISESPRPKTINKISKMSAEEVINTDEKQVYKMFPRNRADQNYFFEIQALYQTLPRFTGDSKGEITDLKARRAKAKQ